MNSQEARKFLPAFADGELDVEQNLRVLEQMAMDPTNTKRVLHQQQLRRACDKAMDDPQMKCPDELRQKLAAMAVEVERDTLSSDAPGTPNTLSEPRADEYQGPAVIARFRRWAAPLAAAAVLTIVGTIGFSAYRSVANGGYTSDGLITASLAERFGDRHAACTLGEQSPYDTDLFPAELEQLDDSLAQHVGQELDGAALDLSSIGYDFQVAGFCPIPGDGAVHVIYKNPGGDSLSLWIKPYNGKPTLDPGVPYLPPQEHAGRPMMVWREANMVFYLVGDAMEDVRNAQPAIHLATRI